MLMKSINNKVVEIERKEKNVIQEMVVEIRSKKIVSVNMIHLQKKDI